MNGILVMISKIAVIFYIYLENSPYHADHPV